MHLLIVGGTRADRLRAADAAGSGRRIDDVERAFPNHQTGGIRLVLTQSMYVMQAVIDSGPSERVVATADRKALQACATEALERRGPWRLFELHDLNAAAGDGDGAAVTTASTHRQGYAASAFVLGMPARLLPDDELLQRLDAAYRIDDPRARLAECREAAGAAPHAAVAWIALASAARENGDAAGAREALDRTLALAPEWPAAHYEDGKFWLAADDMPRARDRFRRAGDLMPAFSAAFSNLGATLGELDEPEAALVALEQALAADPESFTILNNIGVVMRELGRLADAEAAFERVVAMAPSFVFGYYNLGHTRLLAGNYSGAVAAYEAGRARDGSASPRQGARLAMARLAAGDVQRAEADLWHAISAAAPQEREDILLEAYEIGQALLTAHPALAASEPLLRRIASAVTNPHALNDPENRSHIP